MGIKLTGHQMMIVKQMGRMSEAFANSMLLVMRNHGLDTVEGCKLNIDICPKFSNIAREVRIGNKEGDFGFINLVRGVNDAEYTIFFSCSEEYEKLFDREAEAAGRKRSNHSEKPLPPDGLWIGDPRNDYPVDCGEWDLNDSLS